MRETYGLSFVAARQLFVVARHGFRSTILGSDDHFSTIHTGNHRGARAARPRPAKAGAEPGVERRGPAAAVVSRDRSEPGEDESDLLIVGVLLGRVRRLASRDLDIPLVELREHDAPEWSRLVGTRVRCRSRVTAVHFSAADWAVPLRSADERLLSMLRKMVGAEQRSADALLVAVRALARDHLPGALSLDHAAPALGLSRRTLQRRLSERRTSISQVCDMVRRDLAEELMLDGLWTLGEVAHKVGFAEQASFTRACTRWFGTAPSRRPCLTLSASSGAARTM